MAKSRTLKSEKTVETSTSSVDSKTSDKKKTKPKSEMMKSRSGKRNFTRFSIYIYNVLKQVHDDLTISTRCMEIMNAFVNDIFERLVCEAFALVKRERRNTLQLRDLQTAVKLILPGELAKHAISEATKTMAKYEASNTE